MPARAVHTVGVDAQILVGDLDVVVDLGKDSGRGEAGVVPRDCMRIGL
jgi:hypothetical protein